MDVLTSMVSLGGDSAVLIVLGGWCYGKLATRLTIIETTLEIRKEHCE